jgi:hypothetical protein
MIACLAHGEFEEGEGHLHTILQGPHSMTFVLVLEAIDGLHGSAFCCGISMTLSQLAMASILITM